MASRDQCTYETRLKNPLGDTSEDILKNLTIAVTVLERYCAHNGWSVDVIGMGIRPIYWQ